MSLQTSSLQSLATLTKTIQQESLQSHLGDASQSQVKTKEKEPFSWLGLLQEGATLPNLTTAFDVNNCFLCAALGRAPMIAGPLPSLFTGPRLTPNQRLLLPFGAL